MLDPELADAGLLRVGGLHLGDHAAAFVAERAGFVERRGRARAYEAAVAPDERQVVGKRSFKTAFEHAAIGAEERSETQELGREIGFAVRRSARALRPPRRRRESR